MFPITLVHKSKTFALISDTHGKHKDVQLKPVDFLIHCGDACTGGDMQVLESFFTWFLKAPAKHKIFVPGNHDLVFEFDPETAKKIIPKKVICLEDQSITLENIHFVALNAKPWLHTYPEIEITKPIDFLLTHAPAKNILDPDGCEILLEFIEIEKPKFHIFGHHHKTARQKLQHNNTRCMNVCCSATIF